MCVCVRVTYRCICDWGTPLCPFTIVFQAVCNLMPNHHPDAPKVQGLWLVLAEEGWLENTGRKHCPRRVTRRSCE